MGTCYYKILGVSVRASQEEIKSAFRMLALRWHPDRNPKDAHAAQRFREALDAYETLSDPARRRKYDHARGYARPKPSGGRGAETAGSGRGGTVRDIFEEAFGIQGDWPKERRSYDLRFDLQVPRNAAAGGTYESIEYQRWVYCEHCVGRGRKNGRVYCEMCRGDGGLEEDCSLRVWIPAGSEDGSRLRVSGAGDRPEPGLAAGDLVILVHVVDVRGDAMAAE
jgi:molecular chaperone DnaJ